MCVADADETFAGKPADLKRVIRDHVDSFHVLDVIRSSRQLRVNRRHVTAKELIRRLLMGGKFRGWNYHANTDHFVVDRNEPCPVVLLLVKDQGVAFGRFALSSFITDS